jgi:hypothetical protein
MKYLLVFFIFINGCGGGLAESLLANALGGFIGGLATNKAQKSIDAYEAEQEQLEKEKKQLEDNIQFNKEVNGQPTKEKKDD